MHILLIHQAFVSNDEAGGTRHYELARHLVQSGHRVTAVASTVSYLTGQVLPSARGRWVLREQLEGIEVWRTWTYAALHRSFFTHVLSFLSFMFSSFIGALGVRGAEIVWGTSPPMPQAVSAYLAARLKRVPFVFEVRDLWPDFAVQTGVLRNPLLISASRWLERFLYDHADRLVVNSPGFIPHLRRCGVPESKIDLVPNGVEVSMFNPADQGEAIRQELGLDGKFIALYGGAHGLANDLETVLLAAKRLEVHPDIAFVLVGDGKERPNLIRRAEELGLSNVRFVPAQPKVRMPAFLAAADVCIAILKNIPMFTTTYPNKVFDYMAASRPTVLAIDGAIREVIKAADGGTFVRPGDPEALAGAVLTYYEDPDLRYRHGQNARAYVAAHFDRERQALKLAAVLERVRRDKKMNRRIALAVKRAFDTVVSLTVLTLLSPLIALIALAIRLDSSGPVLYIQDRVGKDGKIFRCYKFRTMVVGAEKMGAGVAQNDPRVTRVGRFLRHWTLDELPQLINVLKGEMSIVGPRPTLLTQVALYGSKERRRLEVKPGMAGWAWIHGRNRIPWRERIELDIWYVDHWSIWLDFLILMRSFGLLLRREGLYGEGGGTPDYKGF